MPLSVIEPALYGLLDHFSLPDDCCEQLAAALELLKADSSSSSAGQQQQQQQQGETKLSRFAGDYAQLRMWAGRGRGGQVEKALQRMLGNALKE
jgi:hypothetical protein